MRLKRASVDVTQAESQTRTPAKDADPRNAVNQPPATLQRLATLGIDGSSDVPKLKLELGATSAPRRSERLLMLSSLFGELESSKPSDGRSARASAPSEPGDQGFAATAILETVISDLNESGHLVDRHQHDLVVSGSAALAIREHFAATRSDLETASRLITLIDPSGVWAAEVVRALSDAGGRPLDRLHLREQATLRTLATIERTTLVRRHEETLKIYRADVRVQGRENAEIPVVLMERSHMTVVIVGAMQPHAVDALLDSLREACVLPTWRCPNLLFMVPPDHNGSSSMTHRINAVAWPLGVAVHVIGEPLTSPSSVWNAMLRVWNQVKKLPNARSGVRLPAPISFSLAEEASRQSTAPIEPARAQLALAHMLHLDGLLGCAVVDSNTGLVLARETREDHPVDMALSAATSTAVLQAHQHAARAMGLTDPIEEIVTGTASRQHVLRTLVGHSDVFLLTVLDRQRANLSTVRFKLQEVERNLS